MCHYTVAVTCVLQLLVTLDYTHLFKIARAMLCAIVAMMCKAYLSLMNNNYMSKGALFPKLDHHQVLYQKSISIYIFYHLFCLHPIATVIALKLYLSIATFALIILLCIFIYLLSF